MIALCPYVSICTFFVCRTRLLCVRDTNSLFFKPLTALKKHTEITIHIGLDNHLYILTLILQERYVLIKDLCLKKEKAIQLRYKTLEVRLNQSEEEEAHLPV